MGATEQFCRLLTAVRRATIPPAALDAARCLLRDGIAVALAGSLEPAIRIIAQHVRSLGAAAQATCINLGFKTSAVSAAYLNGAAMHVLDYEPMWNPPSHALSTTLPGALALGEHLGASGMEILTALVKGVEAHGRLRVASRRYEPRELLFHPPGVAGPIGSAVAAAHLLELNVEQLRHAIGIAASRAGSLIANIGTMTKCTHCGSAAAAGVEAALLAAHGLTANPDVLEAPNGLAQAFFRADWQPQALTATGTALRILEPGFAIKLFPSQYATHFVIHAALEARARIAAIDRIVAIEIVGPSMPYVDRPRPVSGLDGKFSFQYTAACALLDGRIDISTFNDDQCARAELDAMLRRVRFIQSPAIAASLDRMWVEVNVMLDDGSVVSGKCTRPNGAWGAPISESEHLHKVRDCISLVFDDADTRRLIATLGRFEQLNGAEVRELSRTLGGFRD